MQIARIKSKYYNIVLYIDNNKYWGYKFYSNNKIEKLNENVFQYFKFLIPSSNCIQLKDENKYKVILDKETNFKHYFYNNIEDYEMFFLNNGKNAICFFEKETYNKKKINGGKIFKINNTGIIVLTTSALMLAVIASFSNKSGNLTYNRKAQDITEIEDLTVLDIKNKIYSSPYLTEEEKNYIYNEEFLSDILPVINESNYSKYYCLECFDNIIINSYSSDDPYYESSSAYYDPGLPNVISVKDYTGINEKNKGDIAHETIHLSQASFDRNLIKEACGEIISNEYYDKADINCYFEEVKLTKILMEIIGPEPVWYYNFSGDFTPIEECVKPYLTEEDYNKFLNSLIFYEDEEIRKAKQKILKNILEKLYRSIYKTDINYDKVINAIIDDEIPLERYYFNYRYINNEHSYYEENDVKQISFEEAFKNDLIEVSMEIYREVTAYEAINILKNDNFIGNENYLIGVTITKNDKPVTLEELLTNPINEESYHVYGQKKISYDDYMSKEYENYEYDSLVNRFISDKIVEYNGSSDIKISSLKKVYIPTIYDKFEINNSKTR